MAKKKISLEKKIGALTTIVEKGFAAVASDIERIEMKMATKDDMRALEKKLTDKIDGVEESLGDRIDGVIVKVEGVQKTIDTEAIKRSDLQLPRRVHDLEEKVFGQSKHPKHLPS